MERLHHLDGLRAWAVLAVILFHLNIAGFSGGFVGVDVFFVISGYIITRMLVNDIDTGAFSFSRFYVRRALRLMPALIVVTAFTGVGAFLFLTPVQLQSFATSAIATLTAWSNVLFWSETGYFDAAATTKPLLHTWSLSVEWQFYAVWPALTLALLSFARRLAAPIILGIAVISFASNYMQVAPASIFYLAPFRGFEFAVGALVLWLPRARRGLFADLVTIAGLLLILIAITTFDEKTFFPAHNALLPVLGAAAVLWGASISAAGVIVRNPAAAYVGRISYSTYLVHWPLIVFAGIASRFDAATILIASLLLGALLYHSVELPFWKGRMARNPFAPVAVAVAAALVVGPAQAARTDGWTWRLNPAMRALSDATAAQLASKWGRSGCNDPCVYGHGTRNVLVLGDSHVDHYASALEALGGDKFLFHHLHGGSCYFGLDIQKPPLVGGCATMNAKRPEWLGSASAVIHAQRWPGYSGKLVRKDGTVIPSAETYDAQLADIERMYADFTGKVILMNFVPSVNFGCLLRPTYVDLGCSVHDLKYSREFAAKARAMVAKHPGKFVFLDPADYLCPNGRCAIVNKARQPLHVDENGHLSRYGSGIIGQKIVTELHALPSFAMQVRE